MILIQSQDFDISTNDVIEWLLASKVSYVRLNVEDKSVHPDSLQFDSENNVQMVIKAGDKRICSSEITAYWHRRGSVGTHFHSSKFDFLKENMNQELVSDFKENLYTESHTLGTFLNHRLTETKIKLGHPHRATINKLKMLSEALKAGLDVPATLITRNKAELEKFAAENGELVTKSILNNVFFHYDKESLISYTEEIDEERMAEIPETFYYSLFQAKIPKRLELRIFYLRGKFYAMGIFSQLDDQTTVDFRKYNYEKPNRTVCYQLPQPIEQKLTVLMDALGLDTGSIDMIVGNDGRYVFLEVNPVGQFAMVSRPCNYPLEKYIADYLISGELQVA